MGEMRVEEVVRSGKVVDVVVQDEFTHDIVVEQDGAWRVYGAT